MKELNHLKKNEENPRLIVEHYFNEIISHIKAMQKGMGEESVHAFRVEVKKLRVFLRVMRVNASKPDKLKFPGKFKKMYSLTGRIRDRQLHMKRLNESNCIKEADRLKKEIKKLAGNKKIFLNKQQIKKIDKKMQKVLPLKTDPAFFTAFLHDRFDAIRKIIDKGSYSDKELHEIRKNIKDVVFINRIVREKLRINLVGYQDEKLQVKLEALAHLLGLFNDANISLGFLHASGMKENNRLYSECLADKRQLKENILAEIKDTRWNFD